MIKLLKSLKWGLLYHGKLFISVQQAPQKVGDREIVTQCDTAYSASGHKDVIPTARHVSLQSNPTRRCTFIHVEQTLQLPRTPTMHNYTLSHPPCCSVIISFSELSLGASAIVKRIITFTPTLFVFCKRLGSFHFVTTAAFLRPDFHTLHRAQASMCVCGEPFYS